MENYHEIAGVPGIYKFTPMEILYEFRYNNNFMYCIDFKTGKIIKERNFRDYENIRENKRVSESKKRKKSIKRNSEKAITTTTKN